MSDTGLVALTEKPTNTSIRTSCAVGENLPSRDY